MKGKRNRLLPLLLGLILALGACSLSGCGEKQAELREEYLITYNLNYEGAATRMVRVPAGAKAVDWKVSRTGYRLSGWYTDAGCTTAFDFSEKIGADHTLYAGWTVKPGLAPVTFNLNYTGGEPVTVEVEKGEKIPTKKIPVVERLSMGLNGWYTDAACTRAWNFENDVVTDAMTLYAGYDRLNVVPRDEDGNVIYNNVTVNVWVGSDFGAFRSTLADIAEQFNQEYEGKIRVEVTTQLTSQELFALRVQQTAGKNSTDSTYYSIADVYDLAGIEYSYDQWYEDAARESFVRGKLTTVPLAAAVPHIVYNKELMTKYNGNDPLPTDYASLSTLLQAAYAGESPTKADFRSIVTQASWSYKEATSSVAFLQNDADYFVRKGDEFVNSWSDPAVGARAQKAMANTYALFGDNGENHGTYNATDDSNVANQVSAGKALMGVMSFSAASSVASNAQLGVLPLSGLFTDEDTANKDQIPVHTVGMAFYKKASNVSNTQLAAAAVFVDYATKHSLGFAEKGWYPLTKSVVESDDFKTSDNTLVKYLRQVGLPENFRTFDGFEQQKSIVNSVAAETFILPALKGDGTDLAQRTTELGYQIDGEMF